MFVEILAWLALAALTVFRVAMIVGMIAVIVVVARSLLVHASQPARHAGVAARK